MAASMRGPGQHKCKRPTTCLRHLHRRPRTATWRSSAEQVMMSGLRQERPMVVRAYYASYRWLDRLQAVFSVSFVGVWLSLLSERRRFAVDKEYYDRESTYLTAAYNESGLRDWERAA